MHRRLFVISIALLVAVFAANFVAHATHCQIHGSVKRVDLGGAGLAGWKIAKTPIEGFGMDTVETDALGNFQFTGLPGRVTYRLQPIAPAGWFSNDALPGFNTALGDSGEASTSTRIDDMTVDVFVKNGTVHSGVIFLVATSADTEKYRTATYSDWSHARDWAGKLKAVKCKPHMVDFGFYVVTDSPRTGALDVTFSEQIYPPSMRTIPPFGGSGLDVGGKKWSCGWVGSIQDTGLPARETVYVYGTALKGGRQKVKSYNWKKNDAQAGIVTLGKKTNAIFVQNDLKYPMPNLHNAGEGVFGGPMQTPVMITVGIATAPHSVFFRKYKDVLKSLVSERKGSDIYHTDLPHCLATFDRHNRSIDKPQRALPPDKHNNILFAEQLALKLNVAASDSGIFPQGLGDLKYDNHVSDPTLFDGKTIREIIVQVDSFLSCVAVSKGSDSSDYLDVVEKINSAFSGPMDTVKWSCGKVVCTGVRDLAGITYLHANPSAVPRIDFSRDPVAIYAERPSVFALSQNYPNPFNPTTTIEFTLAQDAVVTLKIYNTLGQEAATVIHEELMDEGMQEVEFDASPLSSGVYFYRIIAQDMEHGATIFQSVKKMTLVK